MKALGWLVQAKWREQEAGVSKVWQGAGGNVKPRGANPIEPDLMANL